MTIVQLPSFDLRVIYDWMRPEAVMAARLTGATPQCWLDAAKGPIAAGSLFSTTRASGINLPNTAGVYQSIGVNELPRTDRGLNGNGQIAAFNVNGNNPQSGTGWATTGTTVTPAPHEDIFHPVYVPSNGGVNDRHGTSATLVFDGSTTVAVKIRYDTGQDDSGLVNAVLGSGVNGLARGPRGEAVSLSQSVTLVSQSLKHMNLLWTPMATSAGNARVGPYADQIGKDIKLLGIDITDQITDAWVSTSSPAPTLLASDIRAMQGIRPSNSQPEPFAGWEAAGLDDGFAGNTIVTIDRLNAAAPRFIAGAGVDADNLTKLIFDTDNRFKLVVRKSGVDEVALQTGAVASTGDKTIEWQAKPGDYGIDATGVAGDTDTSAETLPEGVTTLRVGSDFGVLNPFNGWIKELQILKVAA